MSHKKKMTPAQKAAARWDADEGTLADSANEMTPAGKEEPANGDHFVISLVLIGIVSVAAIVFTTMQGGVPF